MPYTVRGVLDVLAGLDPDTPVMIALPTGRHMGVQYDLGQIVTIDSTEVEDSQVVYLGTGYERDILHGDAGAELGW